MKKMLIVLVALAAATGPAAANCDLIRDPDAKADCRARAEGRAGQCDLIHNADLKANCRARFTPYRSNQCDLIKNHDLRERCRSGL